MFAPATGTGHPAIEIAPVHASRMTILSELGCDPHLSLAPEKIAPATSGLSSASGGMLCRL
jgi:hypothetical protein